MNLPVKKVENHTYNLKYGTAEQHVKTQLRRRLRFAALVGMAKGLADGVFITH